MFEGLKSWIGIFQSNWGAFTKVETCISEKSHTYVCRVQNTLCMCMCTCMCKHRSLSAQRTAVLLRVWLLGLGCWRPCLHLFQRWPLFVLSFQCKICLCMQLFHYSISISFTSSWHRYFINGHIANAHTSHLQAQEEPVLFQTTLLYVAVVAGVQTLCNFSINSRTSAWRMHSSVEFFCFLVFNGHRLVLQNVSMCRAVGTWKDTIKILPWLTHPDTWLLFFGGVVYFYFIRIFLC